MIYDENRAVINKFCNSLYDLDIGKLPGQLAEIFDPDCQFHLMHPFSDFNGPQALFTTVYSPIINAIPDFERRDYIMISGPSTESGDWVGCCGHYVGVFERPWLDIPPTFHPVAIRFHEFFRIENGKVVEMQGIWDIPQLMVQANAWPMSPSLGVNWHAPAPATQDGLQRGKRDEKEAEKSLKIVLDMLEGLQNHADGGPEAMSLEAYWHPKMTWYGPAGIGTNRRITGFRNWHQIPFLKAMPDRGGASDRCHHFFSEGPYVGVTGWPNMKMTVTGDGWLGIAPAGQQITMRSLDFWRCENGLLRENWVLVDLLHVYHQLGVNVFDRMREYTVSRQVNKPLL